MTDWISTRVGMKHATRYPQQRIREISIDEDDEKENEILSTIDFSCMSEEREFNAWITTCKNFAIFAKVTFFSYSFESSG